VFSLITARASLRSRYADCRHLPDCALDPMLPDIRLSAPSRLRPSDLVGPTIHGKRNESLASDRQQRLRFSEVYTPNVLQVLGGHCVIRSSRTAPSALVTSSVNAMLNRNITSPQRDGRLQTSRRQHRRCLGCRKTLLSFLRPSVGFSSPVGTCVRACSRAP